VSVDAAALFALKVGILEEVSARLAASFGGAPVSACVRPGSQVAWDDCECGQLTVHHTSMWPTDHFPSQKGEPPWTKCEPKLWAVTLAVTMLRCSPETSDASTVDCEVWENTVRVQDSDIQAMQQGVFCTLAGQFHVITQHVTVGPEGSCVGSELTVIVGVPNCTDTC
jgi:hypothetical protein